MAVEGRRGASRGCLRRAGNRSRTNDLCCSGLHNATVPGGISQPEVVEFDTGYPLFLQRSLRPASLRQLGYLRRTERGAQQVLSILEEAEEIRDEVHPAMQD
jgi:hypothetical protein